MNDLPDSEPDNIKPASCFKALRSELTLLVIVYFITVIGGSLTIAACGPGCCFVFFSIIAGVSGLLMLRQALPTRCLCLGILLFSIFGMWHEKEARDSWQVFRLRKQLANEQLQKNVPLPSASTNK